MECSADDEIDEPEYFKDCAGFYLDFAARNKNFRAQQLQQTALSFYISAWFGLGARSPHPERADEHKVIDNLLMSLASNVLLAPLASLPSDTFVVKNAMTAGESHFRYMFGKFIRINS